MFHPPSIRKGVIPKEYIAKYLPPNPVVVEAGAHVGWDTIEMARVWKGSEVHAFEPVPHLWQALVRNTRSSKKVACYPFALADKLGWADLNISTGASDASSSLLSPNKHLELHPEVQFKEVIKVPTITLDLWAKNYGIRKVDFLWFDLQGFELAALNAAKNLLEGVTAVYCEVHLIETYSHVPQYSELRDWLSEKGFIVQREELPWPDGGNVLFVRK